MDDPYRRLRYISIEPVVKNFLASASFAAANYSSEKGYRHVCARTSLRLCQSPFSSYRDRLAAIVAAGAYERIEIPYPDIRWENRPQPGEHHYLTVRDEDNVILYRQLGD